MHPFFVRCLLVGLGAALGLTACSGCAPEKHLEPSQASKPQRQFSVHLLVIDDPALATAAEQLAAEWQARTGAKLELRQMTAAELDVAAEAPQPLDAVIYPTALLGTLAERGWLAPLPDNYASNAELAWTDTFELLQVAETVWGQRTMAVPLGSEQLVCYYRADLFERFHKRPPQDWAEYQQLAAFFADRQNLADAAPPADVAWHGAIEPLAPGWGGRVLLARAAAYAKHRDHYSTLFKIDTMEPLVAGEPFVKALADIVAAKPLGPDRAEKVDAAAARQAFLEGHAALAVAVPGHAGVKPAAVAKRPVPTGFAELPGSTKVFNIGNRTWENRLASESPHVPLLGLAGRQGSLAARAHEAHNAFQLLAWLAGREWGPTVSSASPATTLYRPSQARAALAWLDPGTDAAAARQYAEQIEQALGRQAYLFVPRIAGHARYMAALDEAVIQAISGAKTPAEALHVAAEAWRSIAAELGLPAQQAAYRQSLLLSP